MAFSKHTDALTIREIEYSIRIKDMDKGSHEVHDLLCSELTRFDDSLKRSDKLENPIRNFLQTNIERSIVIRDNTKVYFLNYKEHGSFTIQFTLLVITRYVNYGTTRQALDYLVKDTIAGYFEELLERHIPVSITVQTSDNELYEIPANLPHADNNKTRESRDYLPLFLASLTLMATIGIGLILFFQSNQSSSTKHPSEEYKEKYYQLLIEKQVKEAFEAEKYNYLMEKRIESSSDSARQMRSEENKK
jgi:hypothetical protein